MKFGTDYFPENATVSEEIFNIGPLQHIADIPIDRSKLINTVSIFNISMSNS